MLTNFRKTRDGHLMGFMPSRDQLINELYKELVYWRNIQIDIRAGHCTAICGLAAQRVESVEEFREWAFNLPAGLVIATGDGPF